MAVEVGNLLKYFIMCVPYTKMHNIYTQNEPEVTHCP